MGRLLKWFGIGILVVVGLLATTAVAVLAVSDSRLNRVYNISVEKVAIPTDAASIAEGQRLITIRGCTDCHGADFSGGVFLEDPMVGHVEASNLTAGEGGIGQTYTDEDWVRAIRYGVRPDGKALWVMPSNEFNPVTDADLGKMIAYLKSLPPVDHPLPGTRAAALPIRALYLLGQVPLLAVDKIDLNAPRPVEVDTSASVEYGRYLANNCIGCHGANLSGGAVPGVPAEPPFPANLTSDEATGLGTWTEADFRRALREGIRPDGTALALSMPWPNFSALTDDEIKALWLYLQSVPALPEGNR